MDSHLLFISTDFDEFAAGTPTLEAAELPTLMPGEFLASTNLPPLGIRAGQTLIVDSSAVVGDNYISAPGSTLEVQTGGTVGTNFEAVGAAIDIDGGSIGNDFDVASGTAVNVFGGNIGTGLDAFAGSTVNISGGSVGNTFDAFDGSTVNISDGIVSTNFDAENGSLVNIAGGSIGTSFDAFVGSTTNVSGGTIGIDFDADSGSVVNIFGKQFSIAGTDITATLAENMPFTVADRNVTLSGILADGTPFDFFLNSTNLSSTDYFHTGATLSITLVSGLMGDFNDDGTVNAADYTAWRNSLGTEVAVRGDAGDGNFDGRVTQADFFVWKGHYGEANMPGFDERFPFDVPEPAGAVLFTIAAAGVSASRRRRVRTSTML
jgi:hypothetical protein